MKKFLLSIMLTLSMIICVTPTVYAKEVQQIKRNVNGIEYIISIENGDNSTQITVENTSDNDYVVENINYSDNEIVVKEYEEVKSFWGESYDVAEETINCEDFEQQDINTYSNAVKYNGKKHGGLGSGDYYYQYGYTSNKTYLKVGNSSKTKSICLTGLKSSKKSTCDKYTSSIDTSANYYAKACVYSAASGVGIGVIAGLVAANIAFPPSVIITIVVAACGSGSSIIACVNALIDSNTYSNQAKNYFASVVTY